MNRDLMPSRDRSGIPPWGDKEIARFTFRRDLFIERGVDEVYAEQMADRLFERDFERDDRRICLECANYSHRTVACRAGSTPLLDQLQRCPLFAWEKPKK